MRQILTGLSSLLLLTFAAVGFAELRTSLEPRLIDEMGTVRLTIRADGTSQLEAPDLSALETDFEVLGNQTSSRISSINGRTLATVEYQISLRPRHTGEIMVPRLKIGDELSQAIRLVVRPLDPSIKKTIENMVFFETELSQNPVYVQAETVLVRRLYYSQGVQIYSDLPGLPIVKNAVVIALGDTQSRSVLREGQRYGVIEQRFALFPERSGVLTIPSISVTSSVRLQSAGRTRRSGIRVSTEAIDLEVRPIPAGYPSGVPWLPATDIVLTQSWDPGNRTIEIGDPLTFRLDIEATGNRGSAIPPIPMPFLSTQFKIYPEAPVMDEIADSGTIKGQRRETYALIPTEPGIVAVPPVTVTWWDTVSDQLRRTSTPVYELTITGTVIPIQKPPEDEAATDQTQSANQVEESSNRLPNAAGVFALVAIGLTIFILVTMLTARRLNYRLPGIIGYLNVSATADRRRRFKLLSNAARGSDGLALKHALVDYLCTAYQLPATPALARFCTYPGARDQLAALDKQLYAAAGTPSAPETAVTTTANSTEYDSQTLLTLAKAATDRHYQQTRTPALPGLYA